MKRKTVGQQIQDILSRPHSPAECPAKGMFGANCKNCIVVKPSAHKNRKDMKDGKSKIYYEDDRARVRSSLTNEQHHYVNVLEKVAIAAYHVWKNTPHTSKPTALTIDCLNDLYDTLAQVDFMEDDELRDDNE